MGGPDDLDRWYREAVVTFADWLGRPPPKDIHRSATGTTFGDLLSLAYASVVTSDTGAALSTGAEVATVLAEEERRQWPEPDIGIADELRKRIVAALILHGGADDAEQAATVITQIPELLMRLVNASVVSSAGLDRFTPAITGSRCRRSSF